MQPAPGPEGQERLHRGRGAWPGRATEHSSKGEDRSTNIWHSTNDIYRDFQILSYDWREGFKNESLFPPESLKLTPRAGNE
jgi:hypothetical protein